MGITSINVMILNVRHSSVFTFIGFDSSTHLSIWLIPGSPDLIIDVDLESKGRIET